MSKPDLAFSICDYFFDHQTAATLMIDDLAPVSISFVKELKPWFDHGGGRDNKGSLFEYFQSCFLQKFPEVKGTFFIIINDHYKWSQSHGNYHITNTSFNENYITFLKSFGLSFDFAFHGIHHGKVENQKTHQEFTYLTKNDLEEINEKINAFSNSTGISFEGGKFPGYESNSESENIIKELKFKWWAFNKNMKNKVHVENDIFRKKNGVISFPTNFSGENFRPFLKKEITPLQFIKSVYNKFRVLKLENHLQTLYSKKQVISIQEHFTTLRTNGTFQRPNVFTDLYSLELIFNILRGSDIWYATCNEIANYYNLKINTQLNHEKEVLTVESGLKSNNGISISSKSCSVIKNEKNEIIKGFRKNGKWVFNNIKPGKYTQLKFENFPQ